jgi:hypothetical protein
MFEEHVSSPGQLIVPGQEEVTPLRPVPRRTVPINRIEKTMWESALQPLLQRCSELHHAAAMAIQDKGGAFGGHRGILFHRRRRR